MLIKSFTVKDFITYNNPCFSCGGKINLRIAVHDIGHGEVPSYPTAIITPESSKLELVITYNNTLTLNIEHKSNKIGSNNPEWLVSYLKNKKLFLSSTCNGCSSVIESDYLELNLDKGFIAPTYIRYEMLMMLDTLNMYQIKSYFVEKKTTIVVVSVKNKENNNAGKLDKIKFDLPLLPLYKFKTREQIMKKIKTYLIFS